MLPDNTRSTTPVPGHYVDPQDQRVSHIVDQEMGGIAISDASAGLTYQMWTLSYGASGGQMVLSPETGSPMLLFTRGGINDISLAFDQNMRPAVAYTLNGRVYLWWYDTVVLAYVTSDFGIGRTPRLCMDDKRATAVGQSDVLLAYIQAGQLKYRQQRDRFLTERVLLSFVYPNTRILSFGMSEKLRVQIELAEP